MPGACGILLEHEEAVRVVNRVGEELKARGIDVVTYEDTVSTSQNENLNRIVDFHNAQARDLDISVHFNGYEQVSKPMGTEVLYVTQSALAGTMSAAIASVGFINRGPKKRTDLFFLNNANAGDPESRRSRRCSTTARLQVTVYSGHLLKEQLNGTKNELLAEHTDLWLAQYTAGTPTWSQGTYPKWTMWQYSCRKARQDHRGHGAGAAAQSVRALHSVPLGLLGDAEGDRCCTMLRWFVLSAPASS